MMLDRNEGFTGNTDALRALERLAAERPPSAPPFDFVLVESF